MAQTQPVDAYLGTNRTGLAIGATIYQLNGSTLATAFSTTGWYEAPAGSGAWHHAGLSLPDAGGVVAIGVSGTEYMRVAVGAALPLASDYTAARAAKLDNLDVAVSSRSTLTAANVWDALTSGLTTVGSIGKRLADNIDATISSRLGSGSYTAPDNATISTINTKLGTPATSVSADIAALPSAATIATTVWAAGTRTLTSFGTLASDVWAVATRTITGGTVTTVNDKTGYSLSAAGIQAIWDALTSALTTVGSIGKRIADNLDATVSSRLASAGYTTPPTVTAIRTEMDTNSTKLANLDATISSRAPSSTALSTATWTNGRAANLDNLNATVSSRAVPADVTSAQTAILAAITALNNLSQAQAQAATTAALNAYDPPTKTELDAAQAALTAALSALGLVPASSGPLPNVAGALSIVAATTFSATLSGLSIASSWTSVRFTIKRGNLRTDADSTAILQIVKSNPGVGSDGLAIINGAAGTAAQASLTVNQAAGTVAIRIEDDATVKLEPTTYMYDLKVFYGSSESLAYQGSIAVLATATQTV